MTRDWLPPRGPNESPWWVLLGVLAHVALVALVAVAIRRSFPSEPVIIVLVPDGGAVEMPWTSLGGPGRSQAVMGGRERAVTGGQRRPQAVDDRRVEEEVVVVGPPGGVERGEEGPPGRAGRGEGPPGVVREGGRLLGARFGDGRLWVRPWDAIAAAIASAGHDSLDAAANAALLDSVIEARVTAFLQAMPPDSFAIPRQPSWVTEINGKKWGMDGSWIYLGGLKLPSALLALIPFPQGNYDAAKQAADLQRIREDIMQAARRAESLEQFKRNVKETRERRDAEREAKKNQAVKPDSIKT
jgi:hypothetical protein